MSCYLKIYFWFQDAPTEKKEGGDIKVEPMEVEEPDKVKEESTDQPPAEDTKDTPPAPG